MVTSKSYLTYESLSLKLSLPALRRRKVEIMADNDESKPFIIVSDCGMVSINQFKLCMALLESQGYMIRLWVTQWL
jgi:hypothetical protein